MNISLVRPLPNHTGVVTQWFGEHPEWYARYDMAGHNGIDYGVPVGTNVIAASGGIADVYTDPTGYGLHIVVQNDAYRTLYAHLSKAMVRDGQEVKAGETIGLSGNTGNSTGPHLHFGLKLIGMRNPAYADYIDPKPFRDL